MEVRDQLMSSHGVSTTNILEDLVENSIVGKIIPPLLASIALVIKSNPTKHEEKFLPMLRNLLPILDK
jgi:hypothetical protein